MGGQYKILTDKNGNILRYGNNILRFTYGGGFSPLDLNPVLWLDAGQGITKDGSNYVSQWNDLSGNSNDALQPTGVNQPLYVANQLNGEPVVRFDGSNDFLNTGNVDLSTYTGLSIFIVYSLSVTSTDYIFISHNYLGDGYLGTPSYITIFNLSNNTIGMYKYDVPSFTGCDIRGASATGSKIKSFVFDRTLSSNQIKIWDNGNTFGSYIDNGNTVNSFANVPVYIGKHESGAAKYLNGDIAEIIIYDSALNDINRSKVENYLNTKYNIY